MGVLRIIFFFLISLEAELFPPDPYQGEMVKISVSSESADLKLVFNDREYPLYLLPDSSYYALIGISYNVEPSDYTVLIKDEKDSLSLSMEVKERGFPEEIWSYRVRKRLYPKTPKTNKERDIIREAITTESTEKLYEESFILPVLGRVTSPYGTHRVTKGGEGGTRHTGVDIAAPTYTPIVAPARGRVILTGRFRIHGRTVVLDHGQGVTSIYLHLRKILTKEGEIVERGQIIGKVGSSGASTGPHLHWGVYIHGEPVEPLLWTKWGWETELGEVYEDIHIRGRRAS